MAPYYERALSLVGVTPHVRADADQIIANIERRISQHLPAALREWYVLEGACELLKRFSNSDWPISIENLGKDKFIDRGLLVFRHENQHVCTWAVELNGSDDPPVLVDYDGDFGTPIECVDKFSSHIYSCVWDWGTVLKFEPLILAQNRPLSDEALAILHRDFNSEFATRGWPAKKQYRFSTQDQRVLIWAGESQADWHLAAANEHALVSLIRKVSGIDQLEKSLWSNSQSGERILLQARG